MEESCPPASDHPRAVYEDPRQELCHEGSPHLVEDLLSSGMSSSALFCPQLSSLSPEGERDHEPFLMKAGKASTPPHLALRLLREYRESIVSQQHYIQSGASLNK